MSTDESRAANRQAIEEMMRVLGASSDAELARFFMVEAPAVSAWRSRGVPKRVTREYERIRPDAPQLSRMTTRRMQLGVQVMYEGLCLALWLAPSLDALGRRFGPLEFTGKLRNYASFFAEIEVVCGELVAERMATDGIGATDAFELLAREDPATLLNQIIERAMIWRYGEPTLQEPRHTFRGADEA